VQREVAFSERARRIPPSDFRLLRRTSRVLDPTRCIPADFADSMTTFATKKTNFLTDTTLSSTHETIFELTR
jgi:hypothetical protein